MSKFIIYGLTDPRTGEVRYVGKSTSGMNRPRAHRWPTHMRLNTHTAAWVRKLHSLGLTYGIDVIEGARA